jgi:hypothetical protein
VLAIAFAIILAGVTGAVAHRTDEYLEAATMVVSRDQLRVDLRLVPGVAVVSTVLDSIDTNRDGAISEAEEREYGRKVLGDLSLTLDSDRVPLRLVSWRYGSVAEMRRGLGEIQLRFVADLPGGGPHRRIVFENRHRSPIAAYLVNSLVPQEPNIHITDQRRDYRQSMYQLTYEQSPSGTVSVSFDTLLRWGLVVGGLAIAFLNGMAWMRRRRAVVPG